MPSASSRAADPEFGPTDVPTVFFVSKSDDRNRVDYGIRLDAACNPEGKDPVVAYWREFENSPVTTHGLNLPEREYAYGVAEQEELPRSQAGAQMRVRIKALSRDIVLTTFKDARGQCRAVATTTVARVPDAVLESVYLSLRKPRDVAYLDIHGLDPRTGQRMIERIVN
ncbi:MAG: DUF4833 domain-containing protein [Myxococcales bacterium]